jgi:hypothetical protein
VPHERPLIRMLAGGISVLVEIGQAIQLRIPVRVVLVHHVDLDFAEPAGELDLAARGQGLRAEQQHLMIQKSLVDGAEQRVVDAGCKLHAYDLSTERRA